MISLNKQMKGAQNENGELLFFLDVIKVNVLFAKCLGSNSYLGRVRLRGTDPTGDGSFFISIIYLPACLPTNLFIETERQRFLCKTDLYNLGG